tara:strand:- start:434 stop:1561 length:1128 start_codon:yes stop_codon:yes gene_type:complete
MSEIDLSADTSPEGLAAFNQAIMNSATPSIGAAGSGFFGDLLGGVGSFLGGTGGDLLGAGLGINALNELKGLGTKAQTEALNIGKQAQTDTAFKPFTVTTGFGTTTTDPLGTGGYTTTLSPEQEALQKQLATITGGLTTGYGGAPDVSAAQAQAFSGVQGLLSGAQGSTATREQSIYDRIRATQLPEEQRQQIALNELLASQGRTGLRTAQFGGSPEQFAMEKARAEAMNQASLASIGQAQQQRTSDLGAAESMFGLGTQAAGLGSGLQANQLANIGASMGLQYTPENQLLASLNPALTLADIAGTGQRQGAGYLAEAGMSGLEANIAAQRARGEGLAGLYSALLGAQGQTAASAAGASGGIGNAIGGLFSNLFN